MATRWKLWFPAGLLAAILIAAIAFASFRAIGQEPPPGLAQPTSTPDTTRAVDPATATARLAAADPRFGSVLKVVEAGDTASLLDLVAWSDHVCGESRVIYCPGQADGTKVKAINVGLDAFLVTPDALKPTLDLILGGTPLQLTFASRLRDRPSIYYVGFEVHAAKGRGLAPVSDPDHNLTGLFLTLDSSAPQPIIGIDAGVTDQLHAKDIGLQRGPENQDIITLDASY